MAWYWYCQQDDSRHGCYDADYEGRCNAESRKGYDTEELALKAARQHVHSETCIYKKRRSKKL